jgi:transposase
MDTKDRIIKRQEKRIAGLEKLIEKLLIKITDLERRLALNSNNSSKPPSTDGLRKKPSPKSLREKTEKKFGGQEGHTGDTLQRVDNPDEVIEHHATECSTCGESLIGLAVEEVVARQVIDIEIKKKVQEHRAFIKKCKCGVRNSRMPKHVTAPVQYGPGVRALSVYLSQQFVPKERASEFFKELCDIDISDTTLIAFDSECAQNLTPFYEATFAAIMQSDVVNFDETGLRVKGKTHWGHVSSTEQFTHYRITEKRGNIPQDFAGKAVHDHFVSYNKMSNAQHAYCNAHHLRELRAVFEIDGELWAYDLYSLLKYASKLIEPTADQLDQISQAYDRILVEGLALHQRPALRNLRYKKTSAHNLVIRLIKYKAETLRFLYDPSVPFTNNLAERDLRMVKLKQKVSGGFRTEQGANNFAITRSFISTARKQQKNVYASIKSALADNISFDSFVYA